MLSRSVTYPFLRKGHLFNRWKQNPSSDYLSLPQHDEGRSFQRDEALIEMQKLIWNGPRHHRIGTVDKLFQHSVGPQSSPFADSMTAAEVADVEARNNPAKLGSIAQSFSSGTLDLDSLDGLANVYYAFKDDLKLPTSVVDWDQDSSFAADRLTINGFKLQAAESALFPIDDEIVLNITQHSLEWLLRNKLLFEIDFSREGAFSPHNTRKYVPRVHALFFINDSGVFSTLAIHILDSGLTYTPLDDPDDWMLAKLAFSATEVNYQDWRHFVDTHLVHEPIRVEMMRHLSIRHPIHALLSHHYKDLFGLTLMALEQLLQQGTSMDRTFGLGADGSMNFVVDQMKNVDWSIQDIRTRMNTSGLNGIPGYKYRDDALELRSIIYQFVDEFLMLYYGDARSVREDIELQQFAAATSTVVNGFPHAFRDIESLSNTITDIIFSICVQHHAMNSDVAWMAGALPAIPKALWAPLPTSKSSSISLRDFMVPSELVMEEIMLMSTFLRKLSPEENLINSYENAELGTLSGDCIKNFKSKLEMLSKKINEREKHSRRPYLALDPAALPYFVWI